MSAQESVEFCADLVCQAKETLVMEEGIGSDVAPCVIAFDEFGQCIGWAQMVESASSELNQHQRLALVAGMMRAGWHAHSLVFAIEGYLLIGHPSEDEDTGLAHLFAAGDKNVHECISIIYGDADGSLQALSLPYKQELGRRVTWLDNSMRTDGEVPTGIFVNVMRDLFQFVEMVPWPPEGSPAQYMTIMAEQMSQQGFMLIWGNPGGEASDWEIPSEWNI